MSAEVETMAYAGQVPWHGQGVPVSNSLSAHEMLVAAGLDWAVEKRPMFIMHQDKAVKVKDKYALTRATDGRVLSVVSGGYKPVQNADAMSFFHDFVVAGDMKMETAGSLYDGQYIWGLARIGEDFALKGSDQVNGYVLLMQPHKVNYALVTQVTGIRVVCKNTIQIALGSDMQGKGSKVFKMPHTMKFDDSVKSAAKQVLGIAKDQVIEFRTAAEFLASKRAKPAEVIAFFDNVVGFNRAEAEANVEKLAKAAAEKGERIRFEVKPPRLHDQLMAALENSAGADLESAKGTWWGALNAVTFVSDHVAGVNRVTALGSSWIGEKAALKRKALSLSLDAAKAA